jgi:hypothetical protein
VMLLVHHGKQAFGEVGHDEIMAPRRPYVT